jgi:hypothetical protein
LSQPAVDFFDIPSKNENSPPVSKQQQSFFDIPSQQNTWVKPPKPSIAEQIKTAPHLYAREAAAQLYSTPSNVAETHRFLSNHLKEFIEKYEAKHGRELSEKEQQGWEKFTNRVPDFIEYLGEKFPNIFPTYEEAKEKITRRMEKNKVELPEHARAAIERGAVGAGKVTPALLGPGSLAVKGAVLGTGALTEALDLSEGQKLGANLTIPALTSIIQSIVSKRYIPPKGEATHLYEEGKRLGMTDKELAPILATEGQVERHGRMASSVPKTRKSFEQTGEVLGNVIEDMQNRPANLQMLPHAEQTALLTDLRMQRHNIQKRSHALSPEEKSAVTFLDEAIKDIENNGATNRQLIGTWRSVNKAGANKRDIQAIKEPLLKAIGSTDQQLATDLVATNKLYSRYIKNLKEINPSQFNSFIDAGELQQLLGAVFTGNPQSLGKQVLQIASLGTARKISSLVLTDPRAQSLVRNFGRSVRSGSKASTLALGQQLKDYVQKNLPKEYKDINWKELGIED